MPRLTNNKISRPAAALANRPALNNNTMKKDFIFPLIVGIILGGVVMVFWQFNTRLNNAANAMAQIQTAVSQNTAAVNDIVTFISNATGKTQQTTPAAETAE